jgi:hypothetical protein
MMGEVRGTPQKDDCGPLRILPSLSPENILKGPEFEILGSIFFTQI